MDSLSILRGKRILITGHTGFKGTWMTAALRMLGAECFGVSRGISRTSSIALSPEFMNSIDQHFCDVTNFSKLQSITQQVEPSYLIHYAAQPLILAGYVDPYRTHFDNVVGTLNVLELARKIPSLEKVLIITTDKVYKDHQSIWPHRETDKLGGHDPYSSSKAATDLIAQSYADSFFGKNSNRRVLIARGGNVIGGGDLSKGRLIPDIIKSIAEKKPIELRNRHAVRPWQHVIDLTLGYLCFLTKSNLETPTCLNFGPNQDGNISVENLTLKLMRALNTNVSLSFVQASEHETQILKLDNTLARLSLGWEPRISIDDTLSLVADWVRNMQKDHFLLAQSQLRAYIP